MVMSGAHHTCSPLLQLNILVAIRSMYRRRLIGSPNLSYIRHLRLKSLSSGEHGGPGRVDDAIKSNTKRSTARTSSNKPTSNYFSRNSEYNNKIPQLTVLSTRKTAHDHELSDLSSVASMNTILGILEQAQRSVPNKEAETSPETHKSIEQKSSDEEVRPTNTESGDLGANYLTNFFNLKPMQPSGSEEPFAGTSHELVAPSLTRLLYKTESSALLGKNVYEYIVVRYLNDQGISEQGLSGGVEGMGMYQSYIQAFLEALETSHTGSIYRNDRTLTLNKSLNVFQAIAMHFIKRPDAAVATLLEDVDRIVEVDPKLRALVKDEPVSSNSDAEDGKFASNGATLKLPRQFKIEELLSDLNDDKNGPHPTHISPIYDQYDLAKLKDRKYLVQLPFILNDPEVIARVLVKSSGEDDTLALQRILISQSIEGGKLYEIVVRLRLMRAASARLEEDVLALTDAVLKSAVSCKSDLISKVDRFSSKVSKGFLKRTFDESKCIHLMEQQFHVYFAVWYRLSSQDATKWCFRLVDHYREQPLALDELELLREETLEYFKYQTRSDKANKFITEEQNLSNLARDLIISLEELPLAQKLRIL